MFTITKEFTFAAAHHLPTLPEGHKCRRPHGHNYVVVLELAARGTDVNGFVVDYGELDAFDTWLKHTLDHRDLNEVFAGRMVACRQMQTTAEEIARFLFTEIKDLFRGAFGDLLLSVTVRETPKTSATYRATARPAWAEDWTGER